MEPALVVGLLWLGFGAFHIGLGATSIRARLVAALGELGFTIPLGGSAWSLPGSPRAIFTLQDWRRARRLGSAVAAQP